MSLQKIKFGTKYYPISAGAERLVPKQQSMGVNRCFKI